MKQKYIDLHKKYAQGKYPKKWVGLITTHTDIVEEIALQLAEKLVSNGFQVNFKILRTGIALHDIGVYRCFDEDLNPDNSLPKYIYHGFIGHDIIVEEGYDEVIARFSSTHTATGLTIEDIKRENLDVEKKDYIPITLEEEILCYADKFHTKYPSFETYESQSERISKYDKDRKVKMDLYKRKFGIPELTKLHEKYDSWNTKMDNWLSTL